MGGYGDVQMIDENGLRVDGRGPADLRPVSIETGVIPVADGSCLLYTSPSPRDATLSRMPSSA